MPKVVEVLDESKSFKLSTDAIKSMVLTCQQQMGYAVEDVLKVGDFKVGDKLEFSYVITFEKDHMECEVEATESRSEPLIQIRRN